MVWVKFKQWWQDGMYKYQPGMVVDLPKQLGEGYVMSGKAELAQPPKEIAVESKKKRAVPSARSRTTKKTIRLKQNQSLHDLSDELIEDEV